MGPESKDAIFDRHSLFKLIEDRKSESYARSHSNNERKRFTYSLLLLLLLLSNEDKQLISNDWSLTPFFHVMA